MRALSSSGTSTVTEGPRCPGEGLFTTRQKSAGTSSGGSLVPDVVTYFREQGVDLDQAVEA